MKSKSFTLWALLFCCGIAVAQPSKRRSNEIEYINSLQVTGGLGTGTYFGDLCDNFECAVFRPNSSIGLMYRSSNKLILRSELHYIRLYGTDVDGDNFRRNLHFRSNNYEITVGAIYDMFPYERKFRYRNKFTPYLHGALGVMIFSPQAELNGKWISLRPLQTEGKKYARLTPVISYGFGGRLKVNPKLNISYELGYRWTLTDYLDDVSSTYVDNASLEGDAALVADRTHEMEGVTINNRDYDQTNEVWNEGHQRGNPKRNDGYFLMSIKAEYRLMWTSQGGNILRKAKFR